MNLRTTTLGLSLVIVLTACLPSQEGSRFSPVGNDTGSTSGGTTSLDTEEARFLDLINQYRAQNRVGPLTLSNTLNQSASWMSSDMAVNNYLDHMDSLGRDPFTRMQAFGYQCAGASGENIAAGNADAQNTFEQWKSDAPHNENMLSPDYTTIGIARASNPASNFGWYWTTDFGGCGN